MDVDKLLAVIQAAIENWHKAGNEFRDDEEDILNKYLKKREKLDSLGDIVDQLATTHTEMWHVTDKFSSKIDSVALTAARNGNPLNHYRNDLVEKIDETCIKALEDSWRQ